MLYIQRFSIFDNPDASNITLSEIHHSLKEGNIKLLEMQQSLDHGNKTLSDLNTSIEENKIKLSEMKELYGKNTTAQKFFNNL